MLDHKNRSSKGLALIMVLSGLAIVSALFFFFLKGSEKFRLRVEEGAAGAAARWKVSSALEEVKAEILKQTQQGLLTTTALSSANSRLTVDLAAIRRARPELAKEVLFIECVGEGQNLTECSRGLVFPKVFRVVLKSLSKDGKVASLTRAEIQVMNAKLNAFAFLVKAEPSTSIFIGKTNIKGLFGINFSSQALASQPKITFRTDTGPIIFERAFMTNMSSSRDLIVLHQNQLQMQEGMILGHQAMSFESLGTMFETLKQSAVNLNWSPDSVRPVALGSDPVVNASPNSIHHRSNATAVASELVPEDEVVDIARILCSQVILENRDSQVTVKEYNSSDCSGLPIATFANRSIAFNQSIYARGQQVHLSSDAHNFQFKQPSFALLSEGRVFLRSPLIRSEANGPRDGYLTLISKGDMVIDENTKSMLAGSPTFGSITLEPKAEWKTFQADLSYIGADVERSSVVFDQDLFRVGAGANGRGISLGQAEFNGLFVSSVMPTSKMIHSAGGATEVSGFAQTGWNYPIALQGVASTWFDSELSGGALQAVVTHLQKTEENLARALRAMDPSEEDSRNPREINNESPSRPISRADSSAN